MEPFKIVKTEYYEEVDMTVYPLRDSRRIKVVTTTENWCGSDKDPVTSTSFVYLQKEMKMNIGDKISYNNIYDELAKGVIVSIESDMDSYEDVKLKDGVAYYYSKKMGKYTPVKEKNAATMFLAVTGPCGETNYITMNDVI